MSVEASAPAATPAAAEPAATTAPADPAAQPAPETPKPDEFASKFAALTKREKASVDREKALKDRERALEERDKDPAYAAYQQAKANEKLDPLAYLESVGWNYDRLTKFVLNDKKLTTEEKVALLEERIEQDAKAKAEDASKAAKDAEAHAISEFKKSVAAHIEQGGDDTEILRAQGNEAVSLVYAIVEENYEKNGEIMSVADAAKAAEAWLQKRYEPILKSKKFQPKQVEQPQEPTPAPKAPTPTLTNRATTATPPSNSAQHLSDAERRKAAAAMLRWTDD